MQFSRVVFVPIRETERQNDWTPSFRARPQKASVTFPAKQGSHPKTEAFFSSHGQDFWSRAAPQRQSTGTLKSVPGPLAQICRSGLVMSVALSRTWEEKPRLEPAKATTQDLETANRSFDPSAKYCTSSEDTTEVEAHQGWAYKAHHSPDPSASTFSWPLRHHRGLADTSCLPIAEFKCHFHGAFKRHDSRLNFLFLMNRPIEVTRGTRREMEFCPTV